MPFQKVGSQKTLKSLLALHRNKLLSEPGCPWQSPPVVE